MLFCLSLWYECTEKTNTTLIESKGKFKETKHIQILGAITNIVGSIVGTIFFSKLGEHLGKEYFGILGVLLGTVLSYAIIRQPLQNKYICKHLIKQSFTRKTLIFAMFTAILVGMFALDTYIASTFSLYTVKTYLMWGRDTAIIAAVNVSIIFVSMYALYKSFRNVLARFFKR